MTEDGVELRDPTNRPAKIVIAILALLVPLLALFWVTAMPQRLGLLIYPEQIVALMLGASLAVVFLRGIESTNKVMAGLSLVLAVTSLAFAVYVFFRFAALSEATHRYPTEALILGVLVTCLILEGVRRVIGWTLIIIFAALFAYALFGDWVPGALQGRPMQIGDVFRFLGTDSSAVWGQTLQIAAFVVVVFVLFGGLLLAVGGGEFFTQLAMRVAGRGPGNSAKVAVTASALFGTVSGSAVSSVMTTGIMTIPLMKRGGFTPAQAGGIEAVASTGAQLAPPVMGAAAFLMAEFMQVPYRDIVLAAIIPSVLYYMSLYVQVDFIARRDRIPSLSSIERTPIIRVVADGWLPILSFVVLIGAMFLWNMRAEIAAIWAIAAIAGAAFVAGLLKIGTQHLSGRQILNSIIDTGKSTCDILLITAISGMIIGILSTTGLGFALSFYLLDFGGQSMFGLLVLTAIIAIILGLGLPTTGVYLLLGALAAPTLIQLGVPAMAAHMFVLYYGLLSMITPPIALASFAAASIAGATQSATDKEAFRFGWIAYFLPFLFIYKPAVLLIGSWFDIGFVTVTSCIALVLVTGGLVGHALKPIGLPSRVLWTLTGLAMIAPLQDLGGFALEAGVAGFGLIVLVAYVVAGRAAEARPATASVTGRDIS